MLLFLAVHNTLSTEALSFQTDQLPSAAASSSSSSSAPSSASIDAAAPVEVKAEAESQEALASNTKLHARHRHKREDEQPIPESREPTEDRPWLRPRRPRNGPATKVRVAVDVGGVLVVHDPTPAPPPPGSNEAPRPVLDGEPTVSEPKIMPGAIAGLKALVADEKVELYVVSYCGYPREVQSRAVMKKHGIDKYIPEDRWFFTRTHEDKGRACEQEGINLMVDDGYHNHELIRDEAPDVIEGVWLYPSDVKPHQAEKMAKQFNTLDHDRYLLVPAASWKQVAHQIIHDAPRLLQFINQRAELANAVAGDLAGEQPEH